MRWVFILIAAATCSAQQQTLTQYLNLSGAQVTSIRQLNADYSAYLSAGQIRAQAVNTELSGIYAAQPPDPGQLGPRYVELEAIRRDVAAHLAALQKQVAALLSPAQMNALQTLSAALTLQPLITDGQCAFLLDSSALSHWFDTSSLVPTAAVRSGDFSILTGNPFFTQVVPYIPPAPSASFCGSAVFPISIREYLNLTDAQVSAIASASANYSDIYVRRQNSIADLEVRIRDDTAKPSLDPAMLGTEYSQLAGLAQDLQTQAAQARETARGLLTPQQTSQLKVLQDAASLQPVIDSARSCNLIVPLTANPGAALTYANNSCFLQ